MFNHSILRLVLACVTTALCILPAFFSSAQNKEKSVPAFQQKVVAHTDNLSKQPTQTQLERIAEKFQQWQQSNDVAQKNPQLWTNKHLSTEQITAFDVLHKGHPAIEIHWDEDNGTPIYIGATMLFQGVQALSQGNAASLHSYTAKTFLKSIAGLLKLTSPDEELRQTGYQREANGRVHIRFQQTWQGLDVWGKELYVHLDPYGNVDLLNGRFEPSPSTLTNTEAAIEPIEAIRNALEDVQSKTNFRALSPFEKELLAYDGPLAERIVFFDWQTHEPSLAYMVEMRPNLLDRYRYFIDARDGRVLLQYNAVCSDGPATATATDLLGQTRSINTYLHQGNYYLIDATRPMFNSQASVFPDNPAGAIMTLDARNTDGKSLYHVMSANNTWGDASSISAHYNGTQTYEYFRTIHNRNAIDDKGSTIISVIHTTEDGSAMDNAYWNGRMMLYGDGDQAFTPLAASLDVAAHEMAHGVTEHTAGLEYLFQAGALNEHISDAFGIMVDRDDYKIGDDITKTSAYPSGTLRNMQDPHNGGGQDGDPGWQPAHMNEFQNYPESRDHGGVHKNSGIPNKAIYLMCESMGRDNTEKLVYCADKTKLTKQSKFIDYRLGMVKCAEEIFGAGSQQVTACKAAFDQVGITDGSGSGKPGDVPPVNGNDLMLITNADQNDPNSLYIVKPPAQGASDFMALSTTAVQRKPSIADDGSIALFVTGSNNINVIAMNPSFPNEQVLDNSGIWNNVTLSRDKKLIAATTTMKDAKLHVFDISGTPTRSKTFTVTTPSYSQTQVPNTALYADAVDFSFDDEYVLYDSYNEVSLGSGTIGFWEINAMHVYNKSANDFSDGSAMRIFPFEPSISVGNPSFARTKPTVFTFDAQNPDTQEGEVWSYDLNSGTSFKIASVSYPEPGYPTYRGDDNMVSFGAYNTQSRFSVFNMSMNPDGLTPSGLPVAYVIDAGYPVWFRQGSRPAAADPLPEARSNGIVLSQNYPNPASLQHSKTTIQFSVQERGSVSLKIYDVMGREVATLFDGIVEAGGHTFSWDGKTETGSVARAGFYTYRLTSNGTSLSRSLILVH